MSSLVRGSDQAEGALFKEHVKERKFSWQPTDA